MLKIQKGHNYVRRTFSMPEELAVTLEKIAKENNLPLSHLATQCLNYAISEIKQEEKPTQEK